MDTFEFSRKAHQHLFFIVGNLSQSEDAAATANEYDKRSRRSVSRSSGERACRIAPIIRSAFW